MRPCIDHVTAPGPIHRRRSASSRQHRRWKCQVRRWADIGKAYAADSINKVGQLGSGYRSAGPELYARVYAIAAEVECIRICGRGRSGPREDGSDTNDVGAWCIAEMLHDARRDQRDRITYTFSRDRGRKIVNFCGRSTQILLKHAVVIPVGPEGYVLFEPS